VRVDVVAPGGDDLNPILSTAPGGRYNAMAGTSQAAPQAAALAARLVAQGLTGQEVITRIKTTARDLGAPGTDLKFGSGLIDMSAATGVAAAAADLGAPPPVPEPERTRSASMTLTIPSPLPRRDLLARGLIVTCQSTAAGLCRVEVRRPGTILAGGARRGGAGVRTNIRVRLTASGRRIVRSRRSLPVTVVARGPQGASASTTTTIAG
jgi:hypothetical protein